MSEHTPGPWTAEKPRWTAPTDEAHVYDQRGQHIARIPLAGPHQSINEAKSNAFLIAAVPELLHALQLCVRRLDELCEQLNQSGTEAAHQGRAAIAKAIGP